MEKDKALDMLHAEVEKLESGFKFTGPMRPSTYSFTGRRSVPDEIKKPDYAKHG